MGQSYEHQTPHNIYNPDLGRSAFEDVMRAVDAGTIDFKSGMETVRQIQETNDAVAVEGLVDALRDRIKI